MTTAQRAKLLIAMHRPENILALQNGLEKNDGLLYLASSGEAALALLLEHEFALAIVDMTMPDINGFELAELMRGTGKTRHIPIIFISTKESEYQYTFKGCETGEVDFLCTPLDTTALKNKVSLFIALHHARNHIKQTSAELEISRQQLHAAQSQLQQAIAMRDDFMSLVSHELRTPLNTLHMETQLRQLQLKRNDMSAFNHENLEAMVARDSRQIQSMIRLISDLNDVSRLQNGQLSIRPVRFNLSQLLQQIITDLTPQAEAMGSSFVPEIEENVIGVWDELRIEQIILNLLSNALRYGNSKPIGIGLLAKTTHVDVTVCDQGIGIAEAAQQRIFEKFERAEIKQVKNSMGMGLYIARQLTQAHSGTLAVESVLGKGTSFRLTLPR